MQRTSRGFAPALIIAFIAVVIGSGTYLYLSGGREARSVDEIALEAAKLRSQARKERDRLSEIQAQFLSTRPLNLAIADGFDALSSALFDKADLLFDTEISSDITLNFKTPTDVARGIMLGRKKIQGILEKWSIYRDSALQEEIYKETVLSMINDAEEVLEYLKALQNAVEDLTPSGSGLTESEIHTYEVAVEAAKQDVEEVIENLNDALEDAQNAPTSGNPSGSVFGNSGNQGGTTGTTNPNTNTQTGTQPNTPTTPQDVQNQQQIVNEIEKKLEELQKQLKELEQNNPQNQNPVTDYSTDRNYASSESNYVPVWSFPAEDRPSNPIIKSSGNPSLIEGENSD